MKWGVWGLPETELEVLGDVRGKDILELGCGAAQWSIELARLGARPIGMDQSVQQLGYAAGFIRESGVALPLVMGDGERLPFGEASFDLVFCDYGAMTFADPYATVPEVARVLRSEGRFAFSTTTPIFTMSLGEGADHPSPELTGDYFGMHETRYIEADGTESVEFQLPYGEWIRLFRANGFVVEDLIETRPAAGSQSTYRTKEDLEWARRWPMECIWKVRLA
jgi:SAM-dependent methyltransferase